MIVASTTTEFDYADLRVRLPYGTPIEIEDQLLINGNVYHIESVEDDATKRMFVTADVATVTVGVVMIELKIDNSGLQKLLREQPGKRRKFLNALGMTVITEWKLSMQQTDRGGKPGRRGHVPSLPGAPSSY